MSTKEFKGVIPPITTPLDSNGELDEKSFERHIDNLTANGVHGLFTMGTYGEGSVVSRRTWLQVHKKAIAYSKIPVICGAIESSTLRVIEAVKQLEDIGAETVVVTTPFFFRVNNESELIRHFEKICASTKLKIFSYNIPENSGTPIGVNVIKAIRDIDNYVGIKDSSGLIGQMLETIQICKNSKVSVFCGDSLTMGVAILMGADGSVTGPSNYLSKLHIELYEAAKSGNIAETYRLQLEMNELCRANGAARNWMTAVKYMGQSIGIHEEYACWPTLPITDAERKAVDAVYSKFRVNQ